MKHKCHRINYLASYVAQSSMSVFCCDCCFSALNQLTPFIMANLFPERPRQRSYSAPKKIRTTPQPVHTEVKPEEDSSETSDAELNEEEYEGDEESGTADEDDKDDSERDEEENEEDIKAQLDVGSDGDRFRWHTVSVNGRDKILDLKLLEPYMKVISHGGTRTLDTIHVCLIIMSLDERFGLLSQQCIDLNTFLLLFITGYQLGRVLTGSGLCSWARYCILTVLLFR